MISNVMRFRNKIFIVSLMAAFLSGGWFFAASASACVVPVIPNNIVFVPGAPVVNQQAKIYVTINPNCDQDVDGAVEFVVNNIGLGSTPFSYKAQGKTEEVWMSWTPKASGVYLVKAAISSPGWPGGALSEEIYVDGDNDNDGAGDLADSDDDNDGVPDNQDLYPLDPNKAYDTDKDGVDNTMDADDDNDGLADADEKTLGTNLLNPNTDGDAVNDKEDAFPLDPKKTQPDPRPVQPVEPPTPAQSAAGSRLNRESSAPSADATGKTADQIEAGDDAAADVTNTEYLVVSAAPGSFSDPNQTDEEKTAQTKKGWSGFGIWWGVVILFAVMAAAFEIKHRTKRYNQ